MNTVSLIGRLTRDPELRSLSSGQSVCDLRIAVDNGRSREGADRDPTYVDVATFGAQADACAQYLAKGRQVAVSGRLLYNAWEADDGSRRSKHSVIGRVEFLSRPRGESDGSEPARPVVDTVVGAADEEIPF